jgi:preprotein translocase SecE subunit
MAETAQIPAQPSNAVPPKSPPPPRASSSDGKPGYFTIYKKGQGYWTRMGTLMGAIIVAALVAKFFYQQGGAWFTDSEGHPRTNFIYVFCGIFVALFMSIALHIMNKPNVVEFLIATDSEMKKVNWTSRAELLGSTKVVIFFMLLMSFVMFFFDIFFGYVFYILNIVKFKPF